MIYSCILSSDLYFIAHNMSQPTGRGGKSKQQKANTDRTDTLTAPFALSTARTEGKHLHDKFNNKRVQREGAEALACLQSVNAVERPCP